MEKINLHHLYCDEGAIAFIIPFSLNEGGEEKLFGDVKENATSEDCFRKKSQHVSLLRERNGMFSHASTSYDNFARCSLNCPCYYENNENDSNQPQRRSLCRGLSISRRFHDDQAQNIPRLDLFLGTYKVSYKPTLSGGDFSFLIDASLLLTRENNGDRVGYVLFNILLSSIRDDLTIAQDNVLDRIIFVKHLFYKNKLKCIIDVCDKKDETFESNQKMSLQEWTTRVFLPELFSTLEISDGIHLNEYVMRNGAFRYSIIELDNVRCSSPQGNLIHIEAEKQYYANQIYGLLVGDEGWRFFPEEEISRKYDYWSTRNYTYSFFIEHNALVIKQDDDEYKKVSGEWFKHYPNVGYHEYPLLKTCIPGVSSLTFDAFLTSIYKEYTIEHAEEQYKNCDNNPEDKLEALDELLQNYSMSLDEIKNVEDIICSQFNVPIKLRNIQQLYQRQANKVKNKANNDQNDNIQALTKITLTISLATFVTTLLSVALVILGYNLKPHSFMGISPFTPFSGMAILILLAITVYCILRNRYKKKYYNKK